MRYPFIPILFAVAALFILFGCTTGGPLTGTPLEAKTTAPGQPAITQPAKTNCPVDCAPGTCFNGACVCPAGSRSCNGGCTTGCCTENDCQLGEKCTSNRCSLPPKLCGYLETWNETTNACECAQGNRYCKSQSKCIPDKACCDQSDCTRFDNVCGQTRIAAVSCISDRDTICKNAAEGQTERYELLGGDHQFRINRVLQNGIVSARLDNQDIANLTLDTRHNTGNATLYTTGIIVYSGECRLKR